MLEKAARQRYQSVLVGGWMGVMVGLRRFVGRLMIAAILAAAPGAAMSGPTESGAPRDSLPLAGGTVVNPEWVVKPTGEELQRYYPSLAAQLGVGGTVKLRCAVAIDGTLGDCSATDETPLGIGFGEAALNVAKHCRMRPMTVNGVPVAGATVVIPLSFARPDEEDAPIPPSIEEPKDVTTLALARKMVAATGVKAHLVTSWQTRIERQYDYLPADRTPQQTQAIESLKQAISQEADAYVEFAAKADAATMSPETIKAVTAFYQTPAGKAWADKEGASNKAMQDVYNYIYRRAGIDARNDFCKKVSCGPTP